jgi:vacuolar-type H+-ATPase subunit E/Vma4
MSWTLDQESLEPLRSALLATAHRKADAAVAAAVADGEAQVESARRRAEQQVADARARGEAEASAAMASETASTGQRARTIVLESRRSLYEELRRRTRIGVRNLRNEPGYNALRAALEARARTHLGRRVVCEEPAAGGVVVSAPGRRIDASLDALADWAIEDDPGLDEEALS